MRSVPSRILAAFIALSFTAAANAAPVATPLGVVVAANRAQVGQDQALKGSTVFQGDRLATTQNGQLQVRLGGTQARLLPGSSAIVDRKDGAVSASLLSGSVSMASAAGEAFSLTANQAVIRPVASQAVVAQVTRVSPSELLLASSKGALEVTFDGEVTTIPAGSSYRMLLDGPEAQGSGATSPGHVSRRRLIFVLLGVGAATTGIAIAATSGGSPVSPATP
jgi:hypothetical protein